MRSLVKLQACTLIVVLATAMAATHTSVAPPLGEKKTPTLYG